MVWCGVRSRNHTAKWRAGRAGLHKSYQDLRTDSFMTHTKQCCIDFARCLRFNRTSSTAKSGITANFKQLTSHNIHLVQVQLGLHLDLVLVHRFSWQNAILSFPFSHAKIGTDAGHHLPRLAAAAASRAAPKRLDQNFWIRNYISAEKIYRLSSVLSIGSFGLRKPGE